MQVHSFWNKYVFNARDVLPMMRYNTQVDEEEETQQCHSCEEDEEPSKQGRFQR